MKKKVTSIDFDECRRSIVKGLEKCIEINHLKINELITIEGVGSILANSIIHDRYYVEMIEETEKAMETIEKFHPGVTEVIMEILQKRNDEKYSNYLKKKS